jgi:hypothetical protein
MNGLAALSESLEADIARLERESSKHKRLYRGCQTAVIALTSTTTVVAGAGLVLPASSGRAIQFTVLCLTALSTAIAAWAEMRHARELWQHERGVYYALIDIRRELQFEAARGKLGKHQLDGFFGRITAVLGSSSAQWQAIQRKRDGEAEAPSARGGS